MKLRMNLTIKTLASLVGCAVLLAAIYNSHARGRSPAGATPEKSEIVRLETKAGNLVMGGADFVGEPSDQPIVVHLKTKCGVNQPEKIIEGGQSVCDYIGVDEDAATGEIVLVYKSSLDGEGKGCGAVKRRPYKNPCRSK